MKKTQKKTDQFTPGVLAGAIGVLLVHVALSLISYGYTSLRNPPQFEIGDCLVNRAYEYIVVRDVYSALKEYSLKPQKVVNDPAYGELPYRYQLVTDMDKYTYITTFEHAHKYYVKVKCVQ